MGRQAVHALLQGAQGRVLLQEGPGHGVDHGLGAVELAEVQPEDGAGVRRLPQAAGLLQPAEEAPDKGGLALAHHAVDQDARLLALLGQPLQLLDGPAPADEALPLQPGLPREAAGGLGAGPAPQVRQDPLLLLGLLIELGDDPVAEGVVPALVAIHGDPALPHGGLRSAGAQKLLIKGVDEGLGAAGEEAVAHGDDAADLGPQEAGGHRGIDVPGLPVDPGGLAGVQDHHGDPTLPEELAQGLGADGIGLHAALLFLLKEQAALRPAGGLGVIAAVAVEVDDMVVARAGLQSPAQIVEAGRAQHVHLNGPVALADQLHQVTGEEVIVDVPFPGPGDHQKDVQALPVPGLQPVEDLDVLGLALHGAVQKEEAAPLVPQGLPGPTEHGGRIADDPDLNAFQVLLGRVQAAQSFAGKELLQRILPPAVQGLLHRLGLFRVGAVGAFQILLQIPDQAIPEVQIVIALHRGGLRPPQGDGGIALGLPMDRELLPGLRMAAVSNRDQQLLTCFLYMVRLRPAECRRLFLIACSLLLVPYCLLLIPFREAAGRRGRRPLRREGPEFVIVRPALHKFRQPNMLR